jgi:alanyl-tRNA synthetase
VLGDHVKQAGSMVGPDRLRFDFTHFSQVSAEELETIERLANERIRANVPVRTDEMDAEAALSSGAMALFEEKYGDRVRVVSLGDFSKELCGGTHTRNTGDIGLFKVVSESSVAAGVRRIEAMTGQAALDHVQQMTRIAMAGANMLRTRPEEMVTRLEQILTAQKASEKEVEKLKASLADAKASGGSDAVQTINGITAVVQKVAVDKPSALRDLADRFKDRIKSGVVVLGGSTGGKALLIAVVTKDLLDRYHAGKMIKELAAVVGGGGGGRPDMAQAGGTRPENLDLALERARALIAGQ